MNLPKLQETIDIPKELPISRLVLNIPRSYSLDDHVLRYHRRRHLQLNKEDEEGLSRSFSVGTKEEMNHPFDAPIHSAEQYSYPDTTHTTEAPPLLDHEIRIPNQYGTIHAMAVQGSVIVIGTSHNHIHAFHIQEISEALFSTVIPSPITIPVASNTLIDSIRCLCFSPTFRDTAVVWAGTENGSILAKHMETGEVRTRKITDYPINHILRHRNTELWTMDTAGNLTIWPMSIEECFSDTLPEHFRVRPCIHHVALSNNRLWTCLEKTVDCFDRTTGSVVSFTIDQETVGEIVQLMVYPDTIYTVHATGQINIWDETTFEKKQCVSISTDQITTAVTVDTHYVWIGFLNGSIAIYNTKSDPWITVKVWHAHTHAVTHLEVDALSSTTVVSMDVEGHIAVWDGLLSDYWIEQHMLTRVNDYCTFSPIQAMICSWNMDAVKPEALTDIDKEKILEWLNGMQSPDIIMIGVQEIVDLGSKTLTASKFHVKRLRPLKKQMNS
ncbi:quinon protein alcohol dehydrogenase-like superfamily [Gilbertella persicaria]|uniref:quinon protein alcohol dehydrogenase-like superfamily n=1 Tax=Gilbertella persicaria TaxID=101096 RepID=UPI002220C7AA|nr:quinon protein alcohol dehydrogenase-like superfamily [Gilbertella persicaria]KAI8091462.1 quinon protein alcohol dehydrogenase-like superfamily [Gilbertella persicaria]